jgi:hypothetical protein
MKQPRISNWLDSQPLLPSRATSDRHKRQWAKIQETQERARKQRAATHLEKSTGWRFESSRFTSFFLTALNTTS